MARARRALGWLFAAATLLMLLSTGAAMVALGHGPQEVAREVGQRSPGELIRYLQRRLQNHPRLEMVLLPGLGWAQRIVERLTALDEVPGLGKGRRIHVDAGAARSDDLHVSDIAALRAAMANAQAGQTIVLADGTYALSEPLYTGRPGAPGRPIRMRPLHADGATLVVTTIAGLRVVQPHWVISGLRWRGACLRHDDCEHALHIVGAASHTVVQDNLMQDFNAHIKVNGEGGRYPDAGVIEFNMLNNSAPRLARKPVAPIDIVAVSRWRVSDNTIVDFVNSAGNKVAYGAQMKGGGSGGVFERNLVVCTTRDMSRPGIRVGLSFGGGGTGQTYCRHGHCVVEHEGGVMRNNVVAHCNDAGLDISHSIGIRAVHNTLINTAGVQIRTDPAWAEVQANLLDGRLHLRGESWADTADNLKGDTRRWFRGPDLLDLRWRSEPDAVRSREPTDFCGRARGPDSPPGALAGAPC